ncbi:hypothetical protein BT96DRAFT_579378 [Gymnopus androsaceus JB14]|uniref:Uncharacterized protein n=1 Tax=Gymnopus androsaceus JB14 TaxID=1447944 RepID=A0A6A4IKP9_9AGAR|nr:hypothetical protein BT96DRAFT_579378 [Gymnopus androsaceus JB14]
MISLHLFIRFDFTMCNPPFYSSIQDVAQSAEAKQYGPNAVCTGAEIEMITSGGESAFVGKMVKESLDIRERCRWYTSMLGKLTSVAQVVDILNSHSIDNYIVTEFIQGQTRRWAVGWSFSDVRLPDTISRIPNQNPALSKCLPPHNTILQPVSCTSEEALHEALSGVLSSIDNIHIRSQKTTRQNEPSEPELEPKFDFLVLAQHDTWSRSARRRQKRKIPDSSSSSVGEFDPPSITSSITAPSEHVLVPSMSMACSIHTRQLLPHDMDLEVGVGMAKIQSPPMVMKKKDFIVEFSWRKGRRPRTF